MQLHHIDLDSLKPAKINVRKHGRTEVTDLVPSIRSLGLIQPLLVRPDQETEGYEVVAGQHRYHALTKLATEGMDAPVPCIVLREGDDAAAIEASLAENVARLPMDEIDQYKAFAALIRQGREVADIAAMFGITERLVHQRLAIANLLNPILTAYRHGKIDPQSVRLLTMASKKQQKEWLELWRSEDKYAPEGYRLKCWLFGGQQIPVRNALFDVEASGLATIADLFDEDAYFTDSEAFWPHQGQAIAEMKDAYLADGWSEVIVHDVGDYFPTYEHVTTAKEGGGKVYLTITRDGEVSAYEGWLPRRETNARAKANDDTGAPSTKPEITKAMQNYLGLHRHAAVRKGLLSAPGIALRLITTHILAGSGLWQIRAEPQHVERSVIAESLSENPAQQAFEAEGTQMTALLGWDWHGTLVCNAGPYRDGHYLVGVFATLQTITDEEVTRVLTYAMAEALEAHTPMVEYLGQVMDIDPAQDWSPDDVFFDLLRDKQVINEMLGELAGPAVAKANLTESAKVQKGIMKDCLTGTRPPHTENWRPRYMAFPMKAYTARGGISAVEMAEALGLR